jgi:nucleoid-associated protein YejK
MSFKFRPTADQARTAIEKGKGRGEKKAAEYKVTFLDVVKGLDMAKKCVCRLDFVDYFITRCNDPEN